MEWDKNFQGLLDSPFGEELIRVLQEDLHDNLIREAQSAQTQESAFGLIKEASGVIKSIDHLKMRGAVAPKNKQSRE